MSPVFYHLGGFPPAALDLERLFPLIGPANAAIARYAGLLEGMRSPNVLLSPMTVQEAVLSSRIEGTQATMGEVLELEAEDAVFVDDTPKKADIREVLNYRAALNESVRLLETIPLSQRLVRDAHRVPNWIGPEGCTVEQARFVPVSAKHVPAAMDAWEKYLHTNAPDVLVQLAIFHAEFEAIHPFLDGNGRLGRLLIPLYLFSRKLLVRPNFYLSEYLERHRDEYYARLLAISRDGDWTGWIAFFLRALTEQASVNQSRVQAILDLYDRRKNWITEKTHSQYAVRSLDWMFQKPIFKSTDFRDSVGVPAPTAMRILRVCRDGGMLRELHVGGGRRAAILCFRELVNIAEGHDAF